MNVHIVTQTFPPRIGGMQSLMYSIAKGLQSESKKVVVYPDHKYKSEDSFNLSFFPSIKILRPFFKKLLVRKNAEINDVAICDTWKSVNAVPKNITKIICFAIGQEFLKSKNNKNIRKIQKAFDRCKYIVSITKFTENLMLSKCFVDKNKLKIIYPTFSVRPPIIKNKRLKDSTLKLISICRIEDRKGLLEAAKALIIIHKILPNFKWHIVGEGPSKQLLKKTIEKSSLIHNVIFEGFVSEEKKQELLSESSLFIMPGYMAKKSIEGFGIVYTEAASYGVPSVGGVDGGASEAVINNKTGWCVNPKNTKKLTEVLSEAITNDVLRNQYGNEAKIFYKKSFSSSIAFDRLNKLVIN